MIPPSFCDLGSKTRDLFTKNYRFGLISLDYTSKSSHDVELGVKGDHEIKAGKLSGSLESTYKFGNGIKSVVKWDTKKTLNTNLSIEDIFATGTKFSGNFSFQPDTGMKTVKSKMVYKRNYFNFGLDMEFPNIKPTLTPSLVIGCTEQKGYVIGGQLTYNSDRMTVVRHKVALGYHTEDLSLIATLVNRTEVEALVFQKVNAEVDLGVNVKWNCNSRDSEFGIGARYAFHSDSSSFVKAKIGSNSMLGLVYGFKARDNVRVDLSAELDAKDLEKGSHRFGLGISYSP